MSEHRIVRRESRLHEHKWASEVCIYYICSCGYETGIKSYALEHVTGLDAPLEEATHE